MSRHTPGPWSHATDLGQLGSIETDDGTVVAQTQPLKGDLNRAVRNANSRLIAASPDLLAALQGWIWARENGASEELAEQYARAAIAKATQ